MVRLSKIIGWCKVQPNWRVPFLKITLLQTVILLCIAGAVSVAVYSSNYKSATPKPAPLLASDNKSSNIGIVTHCSNGICPAATQTVTAPTATPASHNSVTPPPKGSSCNDAEAVFGPSLISWLNLAASISSNTPSPVQAQLNDSYNQLVQSDYSQYVGLMQQFGCAPQLASPALRYPNTASGGDITAQPTCNQSQQVTYEQQYSSAAATAQQKANQDYQTLLAQLAAAGADNGSGPAEAQPAVQSQLNQTLGSLKSTLNNELTGINCPTE